MAWRRDLCSGTWSLWFFASSVVHFLWLILFCLTFTWYLVSWGVLHSYFFGSECGLAYYMYWSYDWLYILNKLFHFGYLFSGVIILRYHRKGLKQKQTEFQTAIRDARLNYRKTKARSLFHTTTKATIKHITAIPWNDYQFFLTFSIE